MMTNTTMVAGVQGLYEMGPFQLRALLQGMRGCAAAAASDSSIFARFDSDAESEARRIGLEALPKGFHIHLVDGSGALHPPEQDDSRPDLERLEISARHENVEARICIFCCGF